MPYLLSTLDAVMWRSGLPESFYPEALTPGLREIGSTTGGNMWGNVYPRSGFVTQVDDYKAAAVVAQRAADVVTRTGQIHVYQPMTASASPGYWPPRRSRKILVPAITNGSSSRRRCPHPARLFRTAPIPFQPMAITPGGYGNPTAAVSVVVRRSSTASIINNKESEYDE